MTGRNYLLLLFVVLSVTASRLADAQAASQEPEASPGSEPAEEPVGVTDSSPDSPILPPGMSLDEALDYAAKPPPTTFPDPVSDDQIFVFTLFEQLEYRIQEEGQDQAGVEAQGWVGTDYHKFWWKAEGDAAFDGMDEGEFELDLLYSRLITPFWNLQGGMQYASDWESSDYSDTWSGVVALQGLAPGSIELDTSVYLSDEADVRAEIEAEYNVWVTQRLVLQPRVELGFAAQDDRDKMVGAGMTGANLDLRLRYEVEREFAPYIGVRYHFLTGETANRTQRAGGDTEQLFLLLGVRLAF